MKPLPIRFPRRVGVFLLFLAVTVSLQWVGGAYQSEFGEFADEPAHYVTGLMVRDYIAALAPGPPMQYAENYYNHYPKVGLGHWPPLFYVVQAAWTLLFSVSRTSVMLLLAVLATILATILYEWVRTEFSVKAGIAAGLLMLCSPIVQILSREVMSETLTAALIISAALCYSQYLDTQDWRHSAWFGLFASMALLTKGTGILLAPLPVVSLFLTRRFQLLARFSFWLPAIIVCSLAGPWYLLAPSSMHQAALPGEAFGVSEAQIVVTLVGYSRVAGPFLVPFILLGLADRIVLPLWRREEVVSKWAVAAALLVCVWMTRVAVLPGRSSRHFVNVMPVLILFAMAGVFWVLGRRLFSKLAARWRLLAVGAALLVAIAVQNQGLRRKEYFGFGAIATDLLAQPRFRDSVILVSSDAPGEGMLISEVATRESRPGHVVLRASKVISSQTWFGHTSRLLFTTPFELMRFLDDVPVGIIVVDTAPRRIPAHHSLLLETINANPALWELFGVYPQQRGEGDQRGEILVYKLAGHESRSPTGIPAQLTPGRLGKSRFGR